MSCTCTLVYTCRVHVYVYTGILTCSLYSRVEKCEISSAGWLFSVTPAYCCGIYIKNIHVLISCTSLNSKYP